MNHKHSNGRWYDQGGNLVPPPMEEQLQGILDSVEKSSYPPALDPCIYILAKVLKDLMERIETLEKLLLPKCIVCGKPAVETGQDIKQTKPATGDKWVHWVPDGPPKAWCKEHLPTPAERASRRYHEEE